MQALTSRAVGCRTCSCNGPLHAAFYNVATCGAQTKQEQVAATSMLEPATQPLTFLPVIDARKLLNLAFDAGLLPTGSTLPLMA